MLDLSDYAPGLLPLHETIAETLYDECDARNNHALADEVQKNRFRVVVYIQVPIQI